MNKNNQSLIDTRKNFMQRKISLTVFLPVFILFLTGTGQIQAQQDDKKKTIDKIIAIVGNNIILHSDVENQYMQYEMQGRTNKENVRCQLFEEMLFQKMLLNKAETDSITIPSSQVNSELDRRMRYFIRQIGSRAKLEEYYNKSIVELKEELRSSIKEQLLVRKVQNKLTKYVSITPSEVKDFYRNMPEDSLPEIPQQFKIAEITIKPEISHEDKLKIKEKLRDLRKRIANGSSFKVLAGLYSEDSKTSESGGETGMFTKGEMAPEFEAAAFDLKVGEISPIVETKKGFHLIKLIEKQGKHINAQHIMLKKKVSAKKLMKAKYRADSLRQKIINTDSLDFKTAAKKYSDTYEQTSAGVMLNKQTGDTYFNPEQLDKKTFFTVNSTPEGKISEPVKITTRDENKAIRIFKVLENNEPHRAQLKTDYSKIKNAALEKKKSRKIKGWINKKADETFIKIMSDQYKQCDFTYKWFE